MNEKAVSVDHSFAIIDVIALRAFGVANEAQRSVAISPGPPQARKARLA